MKQRWIFFLVVFVTVDVLVLRWWLDVRKERRVTAAILASSARYGVDPSLVKAVVWRESRFRPDVRGGAGEIGLMQIREVAAQEWAAAEKISPFAHEHLFDPATNTQAGSWYLAKLLKRYRGTSNPAVYALADYNAGRTHVLRWNNGPAETNAALFLKQITYPGTRRYIETVLLRQEHYR